MGQVCAMYGNIEYVWRSCYFWRSHYAALRSWLISYEAMKRLPSKTKIIFHHSRILLPPNSRKPPPNISWWEFPQTAPRHRSVAVSLSNAVWYCIWHNIFGKKVEQSDLFVVLFCFCLLKLWNIFFVFRRWYANEFMCRDN